MDPLKRPLFRDRCGGGDEWGVMYCSQRCMVQRFRYSTGNGSVVRVGYSAEYHGPAMLARYLALVCYTDIMTAQKRVARVPQVAVTLRMLAKTGAGAVQVSQEWDRSSGRRGGWGQ